MNYFIYIFLLATAFLTGSCGNKNTSVTTPKKEQHEEAENSGTTTLTAEQMKSIRITFGHLEKKQLTASLKANGILRVPNQNKANITALSGGVVKSILVQTGATVAKGQIIATIANISFIALQEEYLSVSAKTTLAEQEFSRQKELQSGNAGALKNLQSSDAELKGLQAKKSSLQKQLELIGIYTSHLTSDNIQSVLHIKSPINGTVSNVMVNIGSYVDANNPIAEVVDNGQLHLDLYVYEKDLEKIRVGQTIHFTLTNNPGKEYDALVYAISNTFESNTKAVSVHASVKGNKEGLIDGMSITALVSLENATVVAVPTNAIVSHEGLEYIFIVAEPHSETGHADTENTGVHDHEQEEHIPEKGSLVFEKILVRKGTTDVGYSEIALLKDIPADARIVTNGAFFILAKMNNKGEEHTH